MVTYRYGKGKMTSFSFSLLPLEATLKASHKKCTIDDIAEQIRKQLKIKKGTLTLEYISVKYEREND
jgi:hypothetical protein